MGVYSNYTYTTMSNTNYTDVEPFVGENFNYHELGIIAASEIAANHNAFMKSIALAELAAVEQTGSTDVLYEAVNFRDIFNKIKMFFKKIIEKIHKIFHTFIAKMSSWFGSNADFARKYEKEIVKGWANVKNDWDYKGYIFTNINLNADQAEAMKITVNDVIDEVKDFIENGSFDKLIKKAINKNNFESAKKCISDTREKMSDIQEIIRSTIIEGLKNNKLTTNIYVSSSSNKLDSQEYTEELFKVFRNNEDSKDDISKNDILKGYGGSIVGMISYIKDFDKIKKKTESTEKKITNGIDKLIKDVDKSSNELIKKNHDSNTTDDDKKANEILVQANSIYQSLYGSLSEITTQAFSALLQAQKDACTQAKEIAVKVIGQSKKITEESYDYSNDSYNSGYDFISSVKLI